MREKDRFGELIRTALREEAAVRRLPEDFSRRLLCGVRAADEASGGGFPRWVKIAASVAVMASFAAFAAWIGASAFKPGSDEANAAEPTDPETEMLSNKGENTMMLRKMPALVGAAVVSLAVPAAELTSEPTFVFLRPETSSFWNTATGDAMTLPIDFPKDATSATLSVSGVGYDKEYVGITEEEFALQLPVPKSPSTENVYDLTLTFDDGTVRTAKLGLIQGLSPDAEGATRCIAPAGSRVWNRTGATAVMPIPYGTTSFTVNGEEQDPGLGGAQGWYALRLKYGQTYTLSLVADGVEYMASLINNKRGLLVIVR